MVLQENLAALAAAQGIAPNLTATDPDSVRIDTTPTGPTASVRTRDGRWIRLHSGRDPIAEAERSVATLMAGGEPPLIICIGPGLGYVLDAIERRGSTTRVLALEPWPAMARALLSRRPWHEWLESGRLTLLVGPAYDGVATASRRLDAGIEPPVVVNPVLDREFSADVAEARALVGRALFGARANAEARRTFAPRYLLNTLRNVPVIAASADVSALEGAFAGVPAIVIGAGPSLDRNIEELRQVRGRALLIAVDTALRPLLDAGIAPELVVSLDPTEANGRHLRNLRDPAATWLVAESSIEPRAFEQFAGRTFIFSVADHHPWPWLRSVGLGRGRLRAWGSVLTAAFDLALQAGCDPIVFAGADLAYSQPRPYCRGTIHEQDWATRAAGGESLEDIWRAAIGARAAVVVDGPAGRPVPTTAPLLAFRDWLVEQSVTCGDRRIVNATGGGVLAGGRIEQRSLADALHTRSSPGAAAVRAAWSSGRRTAAAGAPALQRTLAGLADASGESEPLVSWLAFGAPDLTSGAVRDALLGAANPPAPTGTVPLTQLSPVAPLRYPPERVMAIRAAITGDRAAHAARADNDDAANSEPPAAALARTGSLLAALFRTSSLVDADHPSIVRGEPGRVPASRAFVWGAPATPLVLEYETALAEMLACRYDAGDAAQRAVLDRVHVTLDRGDRGEAADAAPPGVGEDGRTAPHLALLADWLSVVAVWDDQRAAAPVRDRGVVPLRVAAAVIRARAEALRSSPDSASADRVIEALTGLLVRVPASAGLVPVPPRRLPGLSITVPTGSTHEATPMSLFIRAHDEPTVADSEPGPSWLEAARVEHPSGWVGRRRLTGPDLPSCMLGCVFDEAHALFTIVNGTRSVRVDAAGRWEPGASWPGAIVGEVPWGGMGAVAWHNAEISRVMWRERPDGDVTVETMPFAGGRAFPQPDGSFWWTSTRGGLWSWTPGGPWHRLVDTPPVLNLSVGADGVRLDATGDSLDFAVRSRITQAFRWRPGTAAVETIPVGPEGPCWFTSSNGDWTALAYPQVDVVLLRHRHGVERVLTCAYPFTVAWAGSSLVVSTGTGELMLFRDLLATLNMDL